MTTPAYRLLRLFAGLTAAGSLLVIFGGKPFLECREIRTLDFINRGRRISVPKSLSVDAHVIPQLQSLTYVRMRPTSRSTITP